MIKNINRYFVGVFFIVLVSCSSEVYEEYHSFAHQTWHTDSIIEFNYIISDTTEMYDLSLRLRHNINYEFQNIFIFLNSSIQDTFEIQLSDKQGKWLGTGVSDVREVKYMLESGRKFLRKGSHQLRVEQAMRYGFENKIESLENLLEVGLVISKHNE